MKRERRKQANRESARKSRLRKQAEYEGLVKWWESLDMENVALKCELEQLKGDSEKLRLENTALMVLPHNDCLSFLSNVEHILRAFILLVCSLFSCNFF